jgi:ABC-type sugar transport system ATPase subunit
MTRPAASPSAPGAPLVRLEGIGKSFGPVKANQDITLDIHAGRVLALLGENGAGKSTLMSMLSGVFPPDAGASCSTAPRYACASRARPSPRASAWSTSISCLWTA